MAGKIPTASRIDLEKGHFMANGHVYYIQDFITVGRYKPYLQAQHILTFGASIEDHVKFIEFVISQLSQPLTGMTIHKILENAYNVKDRYKNFIHPEDDPWFRFAALFVNREDEDITTLSDQLTAAKIEDWKKEGLDANDFFLLCARQLPVLRAKYLQSHPDAARPKLSDL